MEVDVMEINAALWKLTKGEDIEASAKAVIRYGKNLKKQSRISVGGKITTGDKTDITGDTGYGNVTFTDDNQKTHEFSLGSPKARVGHFRIWKEGKNEIWFHYFWKSDEETAGGEPEVDIFRIRYDLKSLELKHFGTQRSKHMFSLWIFHASLSYIEPLWGSGNEAGVVTFLLGPSPNP